MLSQFCCSSTRPQRHNSTCALVLDVINPMWQLNLLSIGTDDEHTIMGHMSGVQMHFKEVAEHPIVCIWCGLDQVNLVAQSEYEALSNNTFLSTLIGLIAYLCHQQNLQTEMKTMCLKFGSTQWMLMQCITL